MDVPVDDFHAAYQQAASQHSTYSEYALLRELYANQKNSDLLPYLIHSAIEVRYYDDAVAYMNILLSEGTLFEKIEPSVFIEVLLSVDELTLSVLANIKALVYDYTQAGLLTEQQQNFFFALIAFSKGDIDNYGYFVETLTGEYLPRKVSYDRAKAAVFQYAEPPLYYLDGLLALDLFTRGWYTLSRLTAQRLLAVDPNYVLTYQLLSYTNLYTHKPGRAVPYLEKLMQLDPPNEQLYRFLLGVAHYEDKNRAASILAFRKVTDEQYQADTQRYLMLLQLEIEDSEEFVTAVEQLLVLPDLTPFDFYTLFDRLYYDEQHSDFAQEVFAVAPDVAQQID
ncbi:MAG: hypothetical protein H6765_09605 [Candidatus Peribacteria bacterium]|nr:MAG: hypothetical protein H6765_09605 [Candidatus Peribacteria bacterium]